MQFIIPFISSSFFTQFFYTFLTIFYCDDNNSKNSYFSSSYKCLSGIWFYIQVPLCLISIILLLFISYITNLIFYNPMCLRAKNKKIHSSTDVIFLFTKIIMNILFLFFKDTKDCYPLLILCIIFTSINAYCLIKYQGYSNKNIFFINCFLSILLLWGFISLFIGKIFIDLLSFNGSSYLFLVGIILIFIYMFFKSSQEEILFMIDKSSFDSSIIYYKYILKLQTLIEDKDKTRENKLILKSFLIKQEEKCMRKNCFLKQYLNSLSKGIDSDILLYYYMQGLFEEGLNKFNNDTTLTISYIYFLVKRLSKKKKALLLFESINKNIYSIDKLFNIYRCKKILETLWTGFDGKDKENIESEDVIKLFEYKNNVGKFKDLLNNISLLYYDFWLALFSNNCEGKEEFKTLNSIGSKIYKLLNPIEETFNLIYSIKNDDIEILKLYTGYIKNILNDENKFEEYHRLLSNVSNDFSFETREIDYASFDISNLHKEKKEVEYFIINASENSDDRTILNMSIGLSTIIGYQKHEIIGKDINILIPKIFQTIHNSMLKDLTSKIKINLYQTLSNNIKYIPEIINKTIFCKTKSNFLKQLQFKTYLVQTEEGEHIYIVEMIRNSSFPTTWNELGEEPSCCVLTDKNFIIQTFTADCCDILGFNSNVINSNFEITSCILQFTDDVSNIFLENSNQREGNITYLYDNSDFLSNSNNNNPTANQLNKIRNSSKNILNNPGNTFNSHSSSYKLNNIFAQIQNNTDKMNIMKNKIKRKLVKTKYSKPQMITWKISDIYINSLKYEGKKNFRFDKKHSHKNIDNYYKNKFLLTVQECRISGVIVGYYFFFKRIKMIQIKHNDSTEEINYFKRYISNTVEDEQSDYRINKDKKDSSFSMKQINKSNTEQSINKSGFYISQQILNKESKENFKYNNAGTEINLKKSFNLSEEENKVDQNYTLYLISDVKDEKIAENHNQEKDIPLYGHLINKDNELKFFTKIKSNFIPSLATTFEFDLESMSYLPKKIKNINESYNYEQNKHQISKLLTFYQKKLEELHQSTLNMKEEDSSYMNKNDDDESSNENESSHDNLSSYESNESSEEKESEENKKENIKAKYKKSTEKLGEEKDSLFNDLLSPINRPKLNQMQKGSSSKINKNILNIYQNDYYKIKFDKIRYFHYDFIKEVIIEDTKYEKVSKIEKLINQYKKEEFNLENHLLKEMSFSTLIINKENKLKESKFKKLHSRKKSSQVELNENKENNNEKRKILVDNTKELENKIKESLSQEDKQKSIEIFLIISIICLFILIIIGIISNYYIITQIKKDINNIHLICYSAELRTFYNVAVYYLRELTLVNFELPNNSSLEKYYEYPEYKNNRQGYISSLSEKIRNIYIESHVLTESLTSVDLELSENTTKILQDNYLTLYVRKDNLDIYTITTTFSVSLIELNSALYNLAISDTYIQQNVTDVYIFIHNFLNDVGKGIKNQIDVYINEYNLRMKNKKLILIIGMLFIFVIIIFVFIVLCISYKSIIKKKSSYIEGFYGIKISFIRESIKNCEHFIYYLKKQKREDDSGLKHDKNTEFMQNDEEIEKEFEEEMKIYDNSFSSNKNIKEENLHFNTRNTLRKNNNRDSSSIIFFSIIIFIYFIIIYCFFILICLSYNSLMHKILRNSNFMFHLQRIQNNPIDFFNAYREFIFDENSIIYGYSSENYLNLKFEEIFDTKGNDAYIINSTYSYIHNYKKFYEQFYKVSLCSRMEPHYFNSEDDCLNFLQGQIKYGYQITYFTLIDLIRMGINLKKFYFDKNESIVGNLSEFGFRKYEEINENEQKFRLYLFNNGTSHSDINILFNHVLLPFFIEIVNFTSIYIINDANNSESLFYIYMIGYIALNVILFLVICLPFIKNMNSVINNAKKILGIIPIHILSNLSNIKKILNLEKMKNN